MGKPQRCVAFARLRNLTRHRRAVLPKARAMEPPAEGFTGAKSRGADSRIAACRKQARYSPHRHLSILPLVKPVCPGQLCRKHNVRVTVPREGINHMRERPGLYLFSLLLPASLMLGAASGAAAQDSHAHDHAAAAAETSAV